MSKPTVFISHVTDERAVACLLKTLIDDKFLRSVEVFVSSHEENISLGDKWLDAIATSVKHCNLMVVICSPLSVSRPWVNFEAGAGWVRDIPVVPLCHSGLTPGQLPVPLNTFQGGLLGNREDIKELFHSIAKVSWMSPPIIEDESFFCQINQFEANIRDNILLKDSTFIANMLLPHVYLLEICIYASTMDYNDLVNVEPDISDLREHKFSFNDIYRLFNDFLIHAPYIQKVYQAVQEAVNRIADAIRFILSSARLQIAPDLYELLTVFLYSQSLVEFWSAKIATIDKLPDGKDCFREGVIKMIREEKLSPPEHKPSNLINIFIDYYNDLVRYKDWIIQYKYLMARLTQG